MGTIAAMATIPDTAIAATGTIPATVTIDGDDRSAHEIETAD